LLGAIRANGSKQITSRKLGTEAATSHSTGILQLTSLSLFNAGGEERHVTRFIHIAKTLFPAICSEHVGHINFVKNTPVVLKRV